MVMLCFMGPRSRGNGFSSEGIGFVEEEEKTKQHDCTTDFRETQPDIGLPFSARVVVLCKRIVVLRASKCQFGEERM